MQNLFIFVPLLLFFIAYTTRDIYFATIVLMAATSVMLVVEKIVTGTVRKMHLYITGLLLLLGTVTVLLRNPVFIQWKVTIVHWIFAAILLYSQLSGKKPAVQAMMEMAIQDQSKAAADKALEEGKEDQPAEDVELNLTDSQWRLVNGAWGGYFVAIGLLNLYIAFNFDEALWVKFKVFGILGLQMIFLVLTMAWLFRQLSAADKRQKATDD